MITNALVTKAILTLNRVARDHSLAAECGPMADELTEAMGGDKDRRAATGAVGGAKGKGGGRPPEWLWLEDSANGDRWILGHKAAASATGHPSTTIVNHVSRHGQWRAKYETDNGTQTYRVRRPTEKETVWLAENDAALRQSITDAEVAALATPEPALTAEQRRRLPFTDPRRLTGTIVA